VPLVDAVERAHGDSAGFSQGRRELRQAE
jgi:hypothetical protein